MSGHGPRVELGEAVGPLPAAEVGEDHRGADGGSGGLPGAERNARVTDRNEVQPIGARERIRDLQELIVVFHHELERLEADGADLRRAFATMTADRDRWRAQAEQTTPGKGRRG